MTYKTWTDGPFSRGCGENEEEYYVKRWSIWCNGETLLGDDWSPMNCHSHSDGAWSTRQPASEVRQMAHKQGWGTYRARDEWTGKTKTLDLCSACRAKANSLGILKEAS